MKTSTKTEDDREADRTTEEIGLRGVSAQEAFDLAKSVDLKALYARRVRRARGAVDAIIVKAAASGNLQVRIWHPYPEFRGVIETLREELQMDGFEVEDDGSRLCLSWSVPGPWPDAETTTAKDTRPRRTTATGGPHPCRITDQKMSVVEAWEKVRRAALDAYAIEHGIMAGYDDKVPGLGEIEEHIQGIQVKP